MADTMPDEAPPPYSKEDVPKPRNGIPVSARRSMEDEHRPLPVGWIRQYDAKSKHQFFVDTRNSPPRSIWHHPYDDETFLATLSSDERERLEELYRKQSAADIDEAELTDEDHNAPSSSARLPPRNEKPSLRRRMKDKITNSTHEEREERRKKRAEAERQYYEHHLRVREAMSKAMQTGQPQWIGKDRDGRDLFVQPPPMGPGAQWGYPGAGNRYDPYSSGMYNGMYSRPGGVYGRPYRGRYGGGGMPLLGGLAGGLLLGGLLT